VLIKLTGLLLLTPDTHAGALPMHVLMPDSGNHASPTHYPEIGYHTRTPRECGPRPGSTTDPAAFYYDSIQQICYVNMDGWSMEIGTRKDDSTSVVLPLGTYNLSTALGTYVDRKLLSDSPGTHVRSHLTLNEGAPEPDSSCAPYLFTVPRKRPNGVETDSMRLTNVVAWRISDFREPGVVLVRRRLNSGIEDKPDTVWVKCSFFCSFSPGPAEAQAACLSSTWAGGVSGMLK
jgi:hypothetical protein